MTVEHQQAKIEYLTLLEEKAKRLEENKFDSFFPDSGPLSREAYSIHIDFFDKGAEYPERAFIAANRSGKTVSGAYEMNCHLTGDYPHWWKGKRFTTAINAWCAGKKNDTTRDVQQFELLGQMGYFGTGMIPRKNIHSFTRKPGIPNAVQDVFVKHISGKISQLTFKSYEQGIDSFMGTARHVVWFDEELTNPSIYSEAFMRTMTTDGIIYSTFTPLLGLSEVVLSFLPGGKLPKDGIVLPENENLKPTKYVVMPTWDDAPHLAQEEKDKILAQLQPYEIEARTRGIPSLGSGAIYPVAESQIVVEPFEIPSSWKRFYGLDVGWNKTAAIWGAYDEQSDIIYLYSEHYRSQAEPSIHADSIKARGSWIPGVIDPASEGRSQKDGSRLIDEYYYLGLDIVSAERTLVESGLLTCWQRLSSGRMKIFSTLQNTLSEFRVYRRDEKGKIVKERDHLMDAMRYGVMSGLYRAIVEPAYDDDYYDSIHSDTGRDNITGY